MHRFQNENMGPVRISIEHSHAFEGMKVGLVSGRTRLQVLAMPVQSFIAVTHCCATPTCRWLARKFQ